MPRRSPDDSPPRRAFLRTAGLALPIVGVLPAAAAAQAASDVSPRTRREWNVRDFGALGDGAHDDTSAIRQAIDAASKAGGGRVSFPGGVYLTRTLTLYSRVHLAGAGIESTIIRLLNNTNDDLLRTDRHASLVGTGAVDGPYNWSVSDLTLDGNRARNTKGCGLRVYGWGFLLTNLRVRQCAGAGIDSEWTFDDPAETPPDNLRTPGDSMEAQVVNVKVHDCGAGGILWRGPHDTQFLNIVVFTTRTVGIHLRSGPKFSATGCQLVNCHVWGGHLYGFKVEAGYITMDNCMAEWAKSAQVHLNEGDATLTACRFFGNPKAKHVGIEIGSPGNIIYGSQIDARMADLPGGAFKFTNEGGSGKIKALIYQTSGVAYTGQPAKGTQLEILVNGIETGSVNWLPRGSLGWNGGTPIARHLSATAEWKPRSIAPGGSAWIDVPVPDAAPGDTVAVGFSRPIPPGAILAGAISAPGTVVVTLLNTTGGALQLAEGTVRADCWVH